MVPRRVAICLIAIFLTACGSSSSGGQTTDHADAGADAALTPDAGADASADAGSDADAAPDTVSTTAGPVAGVENAGVWRFAGIPYAKPPVGDLRWKAPVAPEAHAQVLVADQFGPACPQKPSAIATDAAGPTDEDCLTLNIWTPEPSSAKSLPVMFWIHGGGFIQGSSQETNGGTLLYDGQNLARKDVVVVSINYRLGALGFLAHKAFESEDDPGQPKAGNYGLLDQIRALKWVQDNIANFGGDPANVTIFGESAGGVSVCALMASPLTDGLFDSAIMESGNCLAAMRKLDQPNGQKEAATDQGDRFAQAIGCADAGDVVACMRSKSAQEVLDALPGSINLLGDGESFEPIIDGHVLDESLAKAIADGSAQQVPFVLGVNGDEGTLFTYTQRSMTAAQYEATVRAKFPVIGDQVLQHYPASDYDKPWKALAALVGDVAFVCPARQTARAHTANGNPTFTYYFTHVTALARSLGLGAHHAAEIPFVFGSFGAGAGRSAEADLSASMQTWWTQFATDSAPGSAGSVDWPQYDADADPWMQLDTDTLGPTSGVRKDFCDFWDTYL